MLAQIMGLNTLIAELGLLQESFLEFLIRESRTSSSASFLVYTIDVSKLVAKLQMAGFTVYSTQDSAFVSRIHISWTQFT